MQLFYVPSYYLTPVVARLATLDGNFSAESQLSGIMPRMVNDVKWIAACVPTTNPRSRSYRISESRRICDFGYKMRKPDRLRWV